MEQPLLERFKFWLCDVFGHLRLSGKSWIHGGQRHEDCNFCGRTQSNECAAGLSNIQK